MFQQSRNTWINFAEKNVSTYALQKFLLYSKDISVFASLYDLEINVTLNNHVISFEQLSLVFVCRARLTYKK